MRILFLTTHCNAGGITSYLSTLAKGFCRQGDKIHIASSGGERENDFRNLGVKTLTLDIRTKSELDPKIYWALRPLSRYIKDNQIDILHAHTRVTQVMGRLLKKMSGKPYLSTCHGYFKRRLSRRMLPCWGEAVIAISQAVQTHLEKDWNVPAQKIFLIESGIDIDEFPFANEILKTKNRKKYNLENAPLIGIIARLSDVKGQDILIQAMAQVNKTRPEAKLILFGKGKMEGTLIHMTRSLGLEENVIFFPNDFNIAEALSVLDVFVMPSRQEGLGLSVMEAQAAGLPVVASNIGGIPSLIEDGQTGVLVPPEDPSALAQGLIKILEQKEFAKTIGHQAREHVRQRFSAEQMVQKTKDLYQMLSKQNERK